MYELVRYFAIFISRFLNTIPQVPLLNHYHPTVSLHARQLLTLSPITGSPDLSLNTLSHFLDRFVYKNPKKPKPTAKGSSAMQPSLENAHTGSVTLVKGEVPSALGVPVNDERFWKRKIEDVPVDQRFFHAYFVRKEERDREKAKKVSRRKGKGDVSDEDDDSPLGSDDDSEAADDVEDSAEGEEVEESDDGGFNLSGKGKKPVPDDDDEEENSDAEEAEIWKVRISVIPMVVQWLTLLLRQ